MSVNGRPVLVGAFKKNRQLISYNIGSIGSLTRIYFSENLVKVRAFNNTGERLPTAEEDICSIL